LYVFNRIAVAAVDRGAGYDAPSLNAMSWPDAWDRTMRSDRSKENVAPRFDGRTTTFPVDSSTAE
jgi:hypothetical protein